MREFKCPWLAVVFLAAVMGGIASFGPFVNEDYEKIKSNAAFLKGGPLWKKLFEPEAGYEHVHYRPVNNLLNAIVARAIGTEKSGPYRAMSAAAFMLAALSVYALSRRTGAGAVAALAATLFFAVHPFNSWFYFQGCWVGNSLALVFMAAAVFAYGRALRCREGVFGWWAAALCGLVYAAAMSKDSGALVALMLLPWAFGDKTTPAARRFTALAFMALGAFFYFVQRAYIIGESDVFTKERLLFSLTHAGSTITQYVWAALRGTNFTYAGPLEHPLGWPYTAAVFAAFLAAAFRFRRTGPLALILWSAAVSWIEIIASTVVGFEMASARLMFFLALAVIAAPLLFRKAEDAARIGGRPAVRRLKAAALAALFLWYSAQSARHVWASLDEDRFYNYHNTTPYSWKLLFTLGRVYCDRKDFGGAARAFEKSLEISPRPVTHNNLALVYAQLGKTNAAVRHLEIAASQEPNDKAFHANLGFALEKQGNLQGAAVHFTRSIEIDPAYQRAYHHLARVLTEMGKNKEAVAIYSAALERMPKTPEICNNLGLILARMGDADLAIAHFEEAIRLDPRYALARNNLGLATAQKGDIEGSLEHFRAALDIDPAYAKAHNNLGIALAQLGRLAEAAPHFYAATRIDPGLENARANFARAGEELRRLGPAGSRPSVPDEEAAARTAPEKK